MRLLYPCSVSGLLFIYGLAVPFFCESDRKNESEKGKLKKHLKAPAITTLITAVLVSDRSD